MDDFDQIFNTALKCSLYHLAAFLDQGTEFEVVVNILGKHQTPLFLRVDLHTVHRSLVLNKRFHFLYEENTSCLLCLPLICNLSQ